MGRPLSPGPGWRRRRCGTIAGGAPLGASAACSGATTRRASRSPEMTRRSDAAVEIGDEGVVTGTARVRYGDARRGSCERRADRLRRSRSMRAGSHGARTLVLAASGRTPTAAGWTPGGTGGTVTKAPRQR